MTSKPVDWTRCAVAFACAPKNLGHAGLTVVVVRKDLLTKHVAHDMCPGVLNWKTNADSGGMWNTPPTFNIYSVRPTSRLDLNHHQVLHHHAS